MSLDWDVTADDVALVLKEHNVAATQDLVDWVFDDINRITAAAAQRDDMDSQIEGALSEIEDILMENKVIFGAKRFVR